MHFQLALVQTNHVIALLQKLYPSLKFEIRKNKTLISFQYHYQFNINLHKNDY